jgi:hypothetical protein
MRTFIAPATVARTATLKKVDAGTARQPLPCLLVCAEAGMSAAAFKGPKIARGDS